MAKQKDTPTEQPNLNTPEEGRGRRFEDLITQEDLGKITAVVVGVGAIGRNVAVALANLGVGKLVLIDDDTVEEVNVGTQGYFPADVGRDKVRATGAMCAMINPTMELRVIKEKYNDRQLLLAEKRDCWAFCCVDDMDARRHIAESLWKHSKVFIDGRMTALAFKWFCKQPDNFTHTDYQHTLFTNDQAFGERCTLRSTPFMSAIAANLMVAWAIKGHNGDFFQPCLTLDLAGELFFATDPAEFNVANLPDTIVGEDADPNVAPTGEAATLGNTFVPCGV